MRRSKGRFESFLMIHGLNVNLRNGVHPIHHAYPERRWLLTSRMLMVIIPVLAMAELLDAAKTLQHDPTEIWTF